MTTRALSPRRPRRLLCAVGARPNFVKVAPILEALRAHADAVEPILVHTGQHRGAAMADAHFADLDLPEPAVRLQVAAGTPSETVGRLMEALDPWVRDLAPDGVLVTGDVSATLAAALVAAYRGIPLLHVEAGLRCGDRDMPEEVNRRVVDGLSELLFVHCAEAEANLRAEGVDPERIVFAGNVMVDALDRWMPLARPPAVLGTAPFLGHEYGVVTLHRPALVDVPTRLAAWMSALETASSRLPLLFPVHPRTWDRLRASGQGPAGREPAWPPRWDVPGSRLVLVPPLSYRESLAALAGARLVVTDSGGVQEETTVLGVACLTARDRTERPVTVTEGTARLIGVVPIALLAEVDRTLAEPRPGPRRPRGWDGRAAVRIAEAVRNWACGSHGSRPAPR